MSTVGARAPVFVSGMDERLVEVEVVPVGPTPSFRPAHPRDLVGGTAPSGLVDLRYRTGRVTSRRPGPRRVSVVSSRCPGTPVD